VTTLSFLSPSRCDSETLVSPLRRALERADEPSLHDLSLEGKVEIRGDVDRLELGTADELVRLTPRRALLLGVEDPLQAVERIRVEGLLAYDMTGALAGLALEGERLMRRLTDLDLDSLPTPGTFARIGAIIVRDEGERFRVYFPQELGHYVAEVVLDAIAGLENR